MLKPDLLVVGPYPEQDMAELARRYHVHALWQAEDRADFLATVAPRIRALATKGELGADAALIDALPNLGIIACYGVGVDAIDLPHAWSRGIRVTNTPDVLTGDVADMAFALLLSAARRIPAGDAYVRSGSWEQQRPLPLARRVFGKRLGIVGLGRVGRALARRAEAFELSIAYHNRARLPDVPYIYHGDPVSLAAAVDFLVICASASTQNRALIGAAVLDALGPSGFLVNVARGSIVDEPVLLSYLREGRIAGAALDVFWNEPRIDTRFAALANVVLQPHRSSGTIETRAAMMSLLCDNLDAFFSGSPLVTEVRQHT